MVAELHKLQMDTQERDEKRTVLPRSDEEAHREATRIVRIAMEGESEAHICLAFNELLKLQAPDPKLFYAVISLFTAEDGLNGPSAFEGPKEQFRRNALGQMAVMSGFTPIGTKHVCVLAKDDPLIQLAQRGSQIHRELAAGFERKPFNPNEYAGDTLGAG